MKTINTKKLKHILKILFSGALLAILLSRITFSDILSHLKEINVIYLLTPFVAYFAGIWISANKWRKALRFYGITVSVSTTSKLYLKGAFYNNFFPSTVGGDAYKYYALSKRNVNESKKAILSSMVLERGFGAITFLILSVMSSFYYHTIIITSKILTIIFVTVTIVLLCFCIWLFLQKVITRIFAPLAGITLVRKALDFVEGLLSIRKNPRLIIEMFCYSFVFCMLSVISLTGIYLSLGIHIGFFELIFVSSIVNLAGMVPISLNNIGVAESMYVLLLSFFGVPPSIALLGSLLGRTALIIASASGAFINDTVLD